MRQPMRTLAVGIVVALLLTLTGGPAFADPLGLAEVAAIIPYFNATASSLSFLIMASPVHDSGPDEHLWFYNAACTRGDSFPIPLTRNDTEVFLVNGHTLVSEGVILIAGTTSGTDQVNLEASFVARLLWFDGTTGHGRVIDRAPAIAFSGLGPTEYPWVALDNGAVFPFFVPDDGATFFERVIFTCPIGTVAGTLAFDMNAVGTLGGMPYAPTTAAITLFAQTYDDDENPGPDWSAGCQCVGLKPINASGFTPVIRLKDINPVYGLVSTYTEIASTADPLVHPPPEGIPRFMYHAGIEVHVVGANLEWWFRGDHGGARAIFNPPGP